MKLGTYLRDNNIGYAEFARIIGMTAKSASVIISRYVTGERTPRPALARKIIEATKGKVTFEDLYGSPSSPETSQ